MKLLRLSREAGVHLLKTFGVKGATQEYQALVEDVKGHALTLTLLGTYLRDAHAGDIRRRDLVKLAEANDEEQGGHAFRVIAAYERQFESEGDKGQRALAMLRLLGLFDRPATADCLGALLHPPTIAGLTQPLIGLSEAQRNLVFTRLEDAKLITVNRDASSIPHSTLRIPHSIDAHPLLREYFAKRLKEEGGMMKGSKDSSFITQPSSFQLAHRRLYEHLCATTKEGDQPTLEDLQPLYQAVAHGCQAGLQQEARVKVYRDRILRGTGSDGFYSTSKLGAFGSDLGAVACFFEQPWSRVSTALTEADQVWLLAVAAFNLRALGRLTESLEPMRAGLEMRIKQGVWKSAAIIASNLSELELTLGEVAGAVGDASQSVTYADRSGDAFIRKTRRARVADALHQAGRRAEAEKLFREAEEIHAKNDPTNPLLYTVSGFQYCDLLLAPCERAAFAIADSSIADCGLRIADLLVACRAVSHRAAQTLDWSVNIFNFGLLTVALDHLTLGRAALYQAIMEHSAIHTPQSALDESALHTPQSAIESAVTGLRRAGTTHHIPRGLLTRAWFRFLSGVPTGQDSAQVDLDEAWEIAARGSMKLHMADIHLYRARLFGLRNSDRGLRIEGAKYPWESPAADLAAAEKLIHECGYHHRDEELADAKRVILGQKLP